jgi:hypothetical protein
LTFSKTEIERLKLVGLDPSVIASHKERVRMYLEGGQNPAFKVFDTCRPQNNLVIKNPGHFESKGKGFVSFVPAAGAATRWHGPVDGLLVALRANDSESIQRARKELIDQGFRAFRLPGLLDDFVQNDLLSEHLSATQRQALIDAIALPVALYPATSDGRSFLGLKRVEHDSLNELTASVFVTAIGRSNDFKIEVQRLNETLNKETITHILEQDASASTVRFNSQLEVCFEDDQLPSVVPAGHGALLEKLISCRHHSGVHSAFIRNIDNVVGAGPIATAETQKFLGFHVWLKDCLDEIRATLNKVNLHQANELALRVLSQLGLSNSLPFVSPIVRLAQCLFSAQIPAQASIDQLVSVYRKPLVTMGQVPNLGKDVGGSPVIAQVRDSDQKICIELHHVSQKDRHRFFQDSQVMTHFNPVFLAVELNDALSEFAQGDHDFWAVSEKNWRGEKVYFQESFLYEILGNSLTSNLVFLEIPRLLFNPHKAMQTTGQKPLSEWM